jgi:Ser/Thr protein kinase RdoA (MazF antagonist)
MESLIPESILARWGDLAGRPHRPYGSGLINKTFLVEGRAGRVILQRLHPVFAATVNEDIDAVTAHLEKKGILTPRILRTDDGALFVLGDDERPWRALTFVDGECFDKVPSSHVATAAGRLVARFHLGVRDLEHDYKHVRAGVHDTRKHLAVLEQALSTHGGHRLFDEVLPLARRLLSAADGLPDLSRLPARHAHGDLKISNLLFRDGRGVCLVDLDTLGRMPWAFEMGDALRSWCNPAGEDVAHVELDVETFEAALAGYGSEVRGLGLLSAEEAGSVVDGLATICLELSARFLADALRESYFGYDPARFPARGEHNLLRGRGQLALYESVASRRTSLLSAARRALD